MRGRSGLGIGIYASTQEMNEGERTKNDKGKKEREKKNSLVPCTHACLLHLLMNLTTTRVDHPTPSSIGNPKRVSQPPTKDIISTKNRSIFVRLLMVLCPHCPVHRQCERCCHGGRCCWRNHCGSLRDGHDHERIFLETRKAVKIAVIYIAVMKFVKLCRGPENDVSKGKDTKKTDKLTSSLRECFEELS